MHNSLFDFIESNDILHRNQFGFQREKLTEHPVLDLYTNMLQVIENKERTSWFFYFVNAFDSVNHEILLDKPSIPLFKSYL